jgi:putative Mn2+ efflux pump MntP
MEGLGIRSIEGMGHGWMIMVDTLVAGWVAGCWLLVAGCWLLVAGFQTSTSDFAKAYSLRRDL